MTIQLSHDRQQFVRSLVQNGGFASEDDVIEAALRLLEQQDDQARLAALKHDIAIGIEQADRGELALFDPQATLARIRSQAAGNS